MPSVEFHATIPPLRLFESLHRGTDCHKKLSWYRLKCLEHWIDEEKESEANVRDSDDPFAVIEKGLESIVYLGCFWQFQSVSCWS